MKQYFMHLQCYIPKNKAHEAVQEFIRQYNHCLIDETKLNEFRAESRLKVAEINGQFPRSQNIMLEHHSFHIGSSRLSVEGNFYMDIQEIERFELTPVRDYGRDLMGDMKADAS